MFIQRFNLTMPLRRARLLLFVSIATWCALIVAPALLRSVDAASPVTSTLYRAFSHVCHQNDARSLHVAGSPLAVCERCSAIYLGFLIGVGIGFSIGSPQPGRLLRWWMVAIVPMLTDVTLEVLGLSPGFTASRLGTGGLFGFVAAAILSPLAVAAIRELTANPRTLFTRSSA
jgi:uncharacterized membrane protein